MKDEKRERERERERVTHPPHTSIEEDKDREDGDRGVAKVTEKVKELKAGEKGG